MKSRVISTEKPMLEEALTLIYGGYSNSKQKEWATTKKKGPVLRFPTVVSVNRTAQSIHIIPLLHTVKPTPQKTVSGLPHTHDF